MLLALKQVSKFAALRVVVETRSNVTPRKTQVLSEDAALGPDLN